MKKALFQAMAVATLAILPATAQAVPIVGTLDLTGAVRVTNTTIDWHPVGTGFGIAQIQSTSNGYFDVLDGQLAQEMDLTGFPVGVALNAPFGIPGFETFPNTNLPGLNFILDIIVSCGQASLNPADECDAGVNSPFRFDQDALGTTVILNFRGRVQDSNNPGEESTFTAKFDATFTGITPQQILATIAAQGFIDSPYSAQKVSVDIPTTTVPEPATLLTFGAGTALLAAHRRRRAKKSVQA